MSEFTVRIDHDGEYIVKLPGQIRDSEHCYGSTLSFLAKSGDVMTVRMVRPGRIVTTELTYGWTATLIERMVRREAAQAAKQASDSLSPGVSAALQNEQITRERVERLEQRMSRIENLNSWEKLKWLFK